MTKEMNTSEEVPAGHASENNGPQIIEENGYRLSITLSRRKTVNRVNLILEGEVGLKNVSSLGIQFKPLLDKFDYLNIQLKNISDLDLASLQLFWNLKKCAGKLGKTVAIMAQLAPETQQLIKTAGLNKIISEK